MDKSGSEFLISQGKGSYVMFLPTDMISVKELRRELRNSLLLNDFPERDIVSIELAADEALTNSISANVNNRTDENIIVRWIIKDQVFTMYIVDYGSGFPLSVEVEARKQQERERCTISEFLAGVHSYQKQKAETLPHNGVYNAHKNLGKGLQIMYNLMDTVKIMYHCDGKITDKPDKNGTYGSIVTLQFDLQKHPY